MDSIFTIRRCARAGYFRRITATLILCTVLIAGVSSRAQTANNPSGSFRSVDLRENLYQLIAMAAKGDSLLQMDRERYNSLWMSFDDEPGITGLIFRRFNIDEETIGVLERAHELASRQELREEEAFLANEIGAYYLAINRYYQASLSLFHCLHLSTEFDLKGAIQASYNLALLYKRIGNTQKAIEYLHNCLPLDPPEKNDDNKIVINSLLSTFYSELNNYDSASKYIYQNKSLYPCTPRAKMLFEYACANKELLGQNLAKAEQHLQTTLNLSRNSADSSLVLMSKLLLIEIKIKSGYFDEARVILDSMQDSFQEIHDSPLLVKYYSLNTDVDSRAKNYPRAVQFQNKLIQLRESFVTDGALKELTDIETHILDKDYKKVLKSQETKLKFQSEIALAYNLIFACLLLIAFATAIIVLFLFKNHSLKRKIFQVLRRQINNRMKEQREKQNQLLNSELSIIKDATFLSNKLKMCLETLSRYEICTGDGMIDEELANYRKVLDKEYRFLNKKIAELKREPKQN